MDGLLIPEVAFSPDNLPGLSALRGPGDVREPGVGGFGGAPAGHRRAAWTWRASPLRSSTSISPPCARLRSRRFHPPARVIRRSTGTWPWYCLRRARRPGGARPSTPRARPWLVEARLFDVYTGEPVPAEKRSLAFRLSYRDPERTLTDDPVNSHHQALVAALARGSGGGTALRFRGRESERQPPAC